MLGSIGCALSSSLTDFVIARIVQGMGGAMMTPVGRMVLVRTISKRELVNAMAWVTTPALIGPVLGPPVGGFITTYATWHWIFIINVPIGLIGIALATRYIEDVRAEHHEPFDIIGMVLAGLGHRRRRLRLLGAGLEFPALDGGGGAGRRRRVLHRGLSGACAAHRQSGARSDAVPAADILRQRDRRLHLPARPRRAAVSAAADAAGRLRHDAVPIRHGHLRHRARRHGHEMGDDDAFCAASASAPFWSINAMISAAFLAVCAAFTPDHAGARSWWRLLLVGGFFRSLQFTSINTLAYAEVEPRRVSRATALVSVAQQLAVSTGVGVGALAVELTVHFNGSPTLAATDFPPAFLAVAAISAMSVFIFARLSPDAGAEMADRLPAPTRNVRSAASVEFD